MASLKGGIYRWLHQEHVVCERWQGRNEQLEIVVIKLYKTGIPEMDFNHIISINLPRAVSRSF